MSWVMVSPELVVAAAADLAGIGSAISSANAAAAVNTTGLLTAGADEVSTAIAAAWWNRCAANLFRDRRATPRIGARRSGCVRSPHLGAGGAIG